MYSHVYDTVLSNNYCTVLTARALDLLNNKLCNGKIYSSEY